MTGPALHLLFDALAVLAAAGVTAWARLARGDLVARTPLGPGGEGYYAALSLGMVLGSYGLGTANLWLTGVPGLGRSILGALTGGILGVEAFKAARGIRGSTGLLFVPTFAALVAVGRIGCALSGLEDHTYGLPTALPWGWDYGDGIARHPVALYESLAMAGFLGLALLALARRWTWFTARGFYWMVGFYALQRLGWEFLKPYAAVLGPFNLFHLTCLGLLVYAGFMLRKEAT